MRLWSLHPSLLDTKGLLAAWREGLLAQHVLRGKTIGYRNHPQLLRFKACEDSIGAINSFLWEIYAESRGRGYNFDFTKISRGPFCNKRILVTTGQLDYEFKLLKSKLLVRDREKYEELLQQDSIPVNDSFTLIDGPIEIWEHIRNEIPGGKMMRIERSTEPNNCGENPEQWSSIAAWESVRADNANDSGNRLCHTKT